MLLENHVKYYFYRASLTFWYLVDSSDSTFDTFVEVERPLLRGYHYSWCNLNRTPQPRSSDLWNLWIKYLELNRHNSYAKALNQEKNNGSYVSKSNKTMSLMQFQYWTSEPKHISHAVANLKRIDLLPLLLKTSQNIKSSPYREWQ